MDWASSQWKQELPPLAIQKINALEEKIERLQKERQQKQLQCECLELALEKEKRKVENEKQQTTASQRELQSLADVCKDFEDKQQRLQNEVQNRDNRIASLEGLLSQAKKENCRLQQLENDLKELRGVREATLLEREQKNESYNSGQNVKLQEKKIDLLSDCLSENSEISILAEKENNKYALNENDLLSSLRKKILDQEKTIQELNLKLVSISDKESTKELHHTYSKTPGRPRMESVEASPALRTKSVWDSFTSTPAKEAVLRHHNDSIVTGSSDEKLMALQTRLKQLCQELDCQRHNFEASKVSMEQKFKEKENALKAELKYQAQANADLDKELKDIRNKYQQEINQSTKKLDMLTAQLKKTEEAKVILEKEVRSMEARITACTLSLKTREEEVQDLQKLKNMADTTIQSLQAQVRDLERKCKNAQEQNSTLSETVKAVELQLDGSCNLAREREADLAKVKKELENLSVSHKNLLNENQELQNKIVTGQTKTEELLQNETILKEQVELMEKEQNQLTDKLNLEMKKSEDLAFAVEEQKSLISLQKEELSLLESKLTELNKEFTDTKLQFEAKIQQLEINLNTSQNESAGLENKLKEYSLAESSLKEKLEQISNEKEEAVSQLTAEESTRLNLESSIFELNNKIKLFEEERTCKSLESDELKKRIANLKIEHEAQLQELERKSSSELVAVQKQLESISSNEKLLSTKLQVLEKEKEELNSNLAEESRKIVSLLDDNEKQRNNILSLQEKLSAKTLDLDSLNQVKETLTEELNEQLSIMSKKEKSLLEELSSLKKEKDSLSKELDSSKNEMQKLQANSAELELNIQTLNNELTQKSSELDKIQNEVLLSGKEYEAQLQELERKSSSELVAVQKQLESISSNEKLLSTKLQVLEKEKEELNSNLAEESRKIVSLLDDNEKQRNNILSLQEKLSAKTLDLDSLNQVKETLTEELNEQLSIMSKKEKSLLEELRSLKKEKDSLSKELDSSKNEMQKLQANSAELELNIQTLNNELTQKSSELDKIQNEVLLSGKEYEAQLQELERKSSSELVAVQKQLESISSNEKLLSTKLQVLEKEKEELNSNLAEESRKIVSLLDDNEKQRNNILSLQEKLSAKTLDLDSLNQVKETLTEELNEQLSIMSKKEKSLLEELSSLKKEKDSLSKELDSSKNEMQKLQANSAELELNIQTLNNELTQKSSELDKIQNEVLLSGKEYEAQLQELERKSSSELVAVQKQLESISSNEKLLSTKLQVLEKEKEELNSNLAEESRKIVSLLDDNEKQRNNILSLQEKLSAKTLDLDSLNQVKETLTEELNEQLSIMSKKEKPLLEAMSSLKKEKDSLSKELDSSKNEMQKLQANSAELELNIQTLNNELTQKSSELDKIQNEVLLSGKEYEAKIQDLNTKLSSMDAECTVAQIELKNCLLEYRYTEEKFKLTEENNKKLNEDLSSEISKSEHLQCSLDELKISLLCLEKELSLKSTQLEEVNKKMTASQTEYEEKIQDLLAGLNSDQSKHSSLESQLQEYKLNETVLKDKIVALEKQVDSLSLRLGDATEETHRLRMDYEDQANKVSALKKELTDKCLEMDRLSAQIENLKKLYEVDVQDLQTRLVDAETETNTTKSQIQNYKENELSLMNQIDLLNSAKQKTTSCLHEEICKRQKLELIIEGLKQFILSLEYDLSCMSEECGDIDKEFLASQSNYEVNIQKLEYQLSAAQERYLALEIQLNNNLSYTDDIKEKLKYMSEEKAQMSSIITAESNRVISLQEANAKLHDEVVLLREQISSQSLELANVKKAMENVNEHKNEIEKLQRKLLESEAERVHFQTQIDELFKVESSSEMEVQKLETENQEIASCLRAEMEKTKELEKVIEHIAAANMALKKEMDCKSLLLNDMAVEKAQYQAKVEELESKLLCSSLPKKLHASSSKELHLDEKVASFRISSFEENLSLRSFEYDELSLENETLKEEFERAIQELQAEISGVKSENEHLRVKMKDVSLNAEMSQNRLELVEKEKQDLDRQLNFENKKIKMLESGIQELKKIILTLQVLLISYNGDIKGLNSEMAGSKDCNEFKDEVMFNSIAAEKEYTSTTPRAEIESFPTFYFPEFRSFSSLPEKEFSAALKKFSFYSLNQICDLENNLISKLERCKFLCSYQLVDHVQLNEMWKIFLFLRRKLRQIQLLKKFMFCFCSILKSSLVAHILHSVNKVTLVKVFPKNFGFTLKDFLYLCNNAFNKILFSVSQTFEKDSCLVNQHSVFFNKYSNIHSNAFHLPVIKKTSFVLCQAKFQRVHWDLKHEHVSKQKLDSIFSARRQDVKKALNSLNAQEVPFFLNFTMSVMEKIGKEFCHSSNDFTNATSGHFSTSALQMKNYLSLLEPSSPIFQILSKYCIDILNLENIAVHDICYWKHHCNILGIDKCDVQKMITLLEHMDKHKKGENGTGNTHTKEEVTPQKNEKCLEQCLKVEKEKQKLLNIAIEEIEKDLGETFLQKEKFKNMALNVCKMLLCLKYDAESFVFSNIQLDRGEISTEMCFCESCIMDEDMSDSPSHDVLTLDHCLKCMDRLIRSGCRLEKEVCELKKDESELKALSRRLEDKNSELEITVDQCNRNLETAHNQMQVLTYDLQKQKEKYEYLSQSVTEKDTLNMQLQAENSILLNSIEEYRTRLRALEEEVSLLSINEEKLEFSLLCKDREIASLKTTFDENVCLLNEIQMKCEEYRNEIDLLNSRISKYEEEKMIGQHMISQNTSFDNSFVPDDLVKSSKTIINELQAKIDSLIKSNNSLNLTIENIEEELKNVYMEKKGVDEALEKLSEQNACFKQEISVSAQKYNDEKKSNENLLLRLKEYEKLMLDNEHVIKQLKTKNETLEKNDSLLKNVLKEHEQVVSKKNSDLTRCHQVIEQLQKRNGELDKANSNLKVQTEDIKKQECLKHQLNEIICQKSDLEKEIKRLKLVETEKDQILERLSEANLQRDNLTGQLRQFTLEFETQKKKNTDLEIKCTELSNSLKDAINSNTSLEKELNKNKNLISILNKELEESSVELKNIRSTKCELIKEISTHKSVEKHLKQEIETLTKNLNNAMDNVKAECNKSQLLMRENETLKINGNAHANIGTELQKLRKTLNGAYNFIVNVLNTILCAVQSYPENTDFEELRLGLMALIVHCTQNSEKEFQVDMFDQLNSFFGTLINNHKDDLVICGLISSIQDSVKSIASIDEPCQGAEASLVISPDTMCNMSVFESTFVRQTNNHSRNILADLQYIKSQTDEIIFNFKKIISKKTEEIEKLKKELKQIPFASAKDESKPSKLDQTSFKWKYELIKRQYRQLEEKYNAAVISSEQMEKTIKKLEVENKNLEEEAEDLSNEIKNMQAYYSNSDELLEALTELNALRQKLKELESENKWLKKEIQDFQLQQTSAEKTSSTADLNSLRHTLKELENENNWLRKRIQEFQLQQTSAAKPTSSCNQRQTQIPKFDKMYLKENNVNRFMKGS